MEGYVKIHRRMLGWEWYTDANVMRVFLHCLLNASFQAHQWRGVTIERGQFITSVAALAGELELTPMQVRTALGKLQSTNEITITATNKNSVITICNYGDYQDDTDGQQQTEQQTGKRANNKQTTNKQQTNNIRREEGNNDNNILLETFTPKGDKGKDNPRAFDFKGVLINEYGAEPDVVEAWIEVRRKRRAVNSEVALKAIVREAQRAGISVNDAVRLAAENSWQSFQAQYIKPGMIAQRPAASEQPVTDENGNLDLAAEVARLTAERDRQRAEREDQQK